jgi:MoaA/NifB/PqqE/SkfB family radical SAM enzyme
MYKYEDITQVHLETTQLCQASCPMCDRNKNGGDVNHFLKNKSLSIEQFKHIFTIPFLKQLKTVYFCGNHGDPIFAPDCLDMFKYMREVNPYLNLGMTTNGGARKPEWWEELAKYKVHVNFSIDGLEDTNHHYRQGVVWKNVEENLDAFITSGGKADWTFLVFNYNEHQVELARQYSKLLGVNKFVPKKSGRYITANMEKKEEHQAIFRKGLGTLLSQPNNPKWRNKALEKDFDIKKIIKEEKVCPKCVAKKEIYISAEGFLLPCCWTAGQMYKWYLPEHSAQIWKHINKFDINTLNSSVKEVMESGFLESIEKAWTGESKLEVCAIKCNKVFDPFAAQWS